MATYKRPSDPYDLMKRLDGVALSLEERAVLWAQYKFADKNGTNSYPSEERLAQYLAVNARTIRRHRKSLRDKGWLIERARGHNAGMKNASIYEVVIPALPVAAETKAKRVPNPAGRNQHTKKASGQTCPIGGEDTLTKNPSKLQDRSNHLPTQPKIEDKSSNLPVGNQGLQEPRGVPDGTTGFEDHVGDDVLAACGSPNRSHSAELRSANDICRTCGTEIFEGDNVLDGCHDGCQSYRLDPWGAIPCHKCGKTFPGTTINGHDCVKK